MAKTAALARPVPSAPAPLPPADRPEVTIFQDGKCIYKGKSIDVFRQHAVYHSVTFVNITRDLGRSVAHVFFASGTTAMLSFERSHNAVALFRGKQPWGNFRCVGATLDSWQYSPISDREIEAVEHVRNLCEHVRALFNTAELSMEDQEEETAATLNYADTVLEAAISFLNREKR